MMQTTGDKSVETEVSEAASESASDASDTAPSATSKPQARQKPHKRQAFRGRLHNWGWRRAIYWEIMNVLARYLGFHIHYVMVSSDRPDLRPQKPVIPEGYESRLAEYADFLPFVGHPELSQEFLDAALANQDEAHLTVFEGELVGFSFNTRVSAPVTDQLEVVVPEGFRYGYKSWTHKDHRQKNLSRMGAWLKQNFAGRPFDERGIFYIETHNYASLLHGYRRPSNRSLKMGLAGWVTVFGRQIPFASRRARWIGFHFQRMDKTYRRYYISSPPSPALSRAFPGAVITCHWYDHCRRYGCPDTLA
ncbi:MAG: hypothetical protein AAF993_07740 [Pseudomonadota bacterium]